MAFVFASCDYSREAPAPVPRSRVRMTSRAVSMSFWFAALSFLCLCYRYQAAAATAPANDRFADAHLLFGPSGMVLDHTEGSTLEPGEATLDSAAQGSVWYQWTPPTNGTYYFK